MDELFKWQRAIDLKDVDFVPKYADTVSKAVIVADIAPDGYDIHDIPLGTIVTIKEQAENGMARCVIKDHPTALLFWCEIKAYNE